MNIPFISTLSSLTWCRWQYISDPAKDRRDLSYLWESPPLTPLALIAVADYVPRTTSAPEVEGSRVERIHPPCGASLSLVGSGGLGTLSAQIRSLKSPPPSIFLIPLLQSRVLRCGGALIRPSEILSSGGYGTRPSAPGAGGCQVVTIGTYLLLRRFLLLLPLPLRGRFWRCRRHLLHCLPYIGGAPGRGAAAAGPSMLPSSPQRHPPIGTRNQTLPPPPPPL